MNGVRSDSQNRRDELQDRGRPEDALPGLLGASNTTFRVQITEAEGSVAFSAGAPVPNRPGPAFRMFEWEGNAVDGPQPASWR